MGIGSIGIWEILVIGVLVLVFFGPERLPEIARSAGKALREFKRGMNEIRREFEEAERSALDDGEETSRPRPRGQVHPPTFGEGEAEGAPGDEDAQEPPAAKDAGQEPAEEAAEEPPDD